MTTTAQPWNYPYVIVGLHYNAQALGDEQEALDASDTLRAYTHTVMNGNMFAGKLYDRIAKYSPLPPLIITRNNWPDGDWRRFKHPDYVKNEMKAGGYRREFEIMYLNEPITGTLAEFASLTESIMAFMDSVADNHAKGAVPGWADAHTWTEALLKSRKADELLIYFSQWTRAGHGHVVHHCYSQFAPQKNGGGANHLDMLDPAKMGPETWPTRDDMTKPSQGSFLAQNADIDWEEQAELDLAYSAAVHLLYGRGASEEGKARFREQIGLSPEEYLTFNVRAQGSEANWTEQRSMWPLNWCTEVLNVEEYEWGEGEMPIDDMPHARVQGWAQQIEAAAGVGKTRGPLDCEPVWDYFWGDEPLKWDTERSVVEMLEWGDNTRPDSCKFRHWFAWNENDQWKTYNIRRRPSWIQAIGTYARRKEARRSPPMPTFPALPPANDGGYQDSKQTAPGSINIRSTPVTGVTNVVGTLVGGDLVRVHNSVNFKDSDGTWRPVVKGGVLGWARVPPAQFARLFGDPPTELVGPHVTQLDTGVSNACGQASLAAVVLYERGRRGDTRPLTVQQVSADMDELFANWSPGQFTTVSQLKLTLDFYGVPAMIVPSVTLAHIRGALDAGRMVIALFERGKLPGATGYHAYTRAHFSTIKGHGQGFFEVWDTLSRPDGHGAPLQVADADLTEALRTSTFVKADGSIGTNAGFQALVVTAPPPPPPTQQTPLALALRLRNEIDLLIEVLENLEETN